MHQHEKSTETMQLVTQLYRHKDENEMAEVFA